MSNNELEKVVVEARKYLVDEDYGKAISFFEKLLKKYPDNPDLNYCMGFVYYKSGNYDTAGKYFRKTIKLEDKYTEAYYFLAVIEKKHGNLENVIQYLNRVIYLNPEFQNAYYNKGVVFLSLKDPERAVKEFSYALYLSPKDQSSLIGILKAYDMMHMAGDFLGKSGRILGTGQVNNKDATAEKSGEIVTSDNANVVVGENEEKAQKAQKEMSAAKEQTVAVDVKPREKEEIFPEQQDNMKITVFSPEGWEKTVLLNTQMIGLKTDNKDNRGAIEIDFPVPYDLSNKSIYFEIKGEKGGETLKGVIRDNATKRSPYFDITNIYKDWRTKVIDIASDSQGYINEEKVTRIKLYLTPVGGDVKTRVWIKDIRVE